jgi:3-methyladenine DNA glycosylase AlkD
MYEYLIDLSYLEFKKEALKIYKKHLQPKEKIAMEKRIINYDGGKILGSTAKINNQILKIAIKRPNKWNEIPKLWETGICEFRVIAHKMFHRVKKSDKEKIKLIKKMVPKAHGWSDTDGLITYNLKKMWRRNPEAAFDYSKKHLKSKNKWERRYAMVVLIPLTDEVGVTTRGKYIPKILSLAQKLLKDPEPYVQKAVSWVIKQGHEHSQDKIFAFLKKHAKTRNKNQVKTIRLAMEYQTPERKLILRNLLKK